MPALVASDDQVSFPTVVSTRFCIHFVVVVFVKYPSCVLVVYWQDLLWPGAVWSVGMLR